jgi:hypothetical protein
MQAGKLLALELPTLLAASENATLQRTLYCQPDEAPPITVPFVQTRALDVATADTLELDLEDAGTVGVTDASRDEVVLIVMTETEVLLDLGAGMLMTGFGALLDPDAAEPRDVLLPE